MTYPTRKEENKLFRRGYKYIAGVDEAGRGAWAGPLVAAAVILPRDFKLPGINDSKKLSPAIREKFYRSIINQALGFQVAKISSKHIDRLGVGQANILAIKKSVLKLKIKPDYVLIDAFKIEIKNIPSLGIIRGDSKVVAIAAASIIAKVTRDRIMKKSHDKYPVYNFGQHKGYGTKDHYQRLMKHGPCSWHRFSFSPIRDN